MQLSLHVIFEAKFYGSEEEVDGSSVEDAIILRDMTDLI